MQVVQDAQRLFLLTPNLINSFGIVSVKKIELPLMASIVWSYHLGGAPLSFHCMISQGNNSVVPAGIEPAERNYKNGFR